MPPASAGSLKQRVEEPSFVGSAEFQERLRVLTKDLPLYVGREVERVEQRELRHRLSGLQIVGAEEQTILAADEELATERRVAADRLSPRTGGQVAPEIRIGVHQFVDRT